MTVAKDILKVVIIGPESTGKSTIAAALAKCFQTDYAPEYARAYIEQLQDSYEYEDLLRIALGQINAEEKALQHARNGIVFYDTDLQVIKVWSEHKYGKCDPKILAETVSRKYDFYFLTNIDLPWEADPQREHPQPEMRQHFFDIYHKIVENSGLPFALLSGSHEERLHQALSVLKDTFGLESGC